METFDQKQAAHLSGWEPRPFRALVERGVILATSETRRRSRGRGHPTLFDRHEVKVASILSQVPWRTGASFGGGGIDIDNMGLVADWLRRELAGAERRSTQKEPYYVLVEPRRDGGWQGEIWQAHDKRLSIIVHDEDGSKRPTPGCSAVNVYTALWWADMADAELQGVFNEAADE